MFKKGEIVRVSSWDCAGGLSESGYQMYAFGIFQGYCIDDNVAVLILANGRIAAARTASISPRSS